MIEEMSGVLQQQNIEIDKFLRAQEEQFRQAMDLKTSRFQMNILASLVEAALRKLKD